ncbi:N-acetylmuramic acid 6-phosphate etherase [Shouchella sp. JSM 1781072]|uniref:N-acetylmuramic acid 6-phosphate etherase n=1 Tax=Bacillaceae TaxID=186817 RepID=UPI0020D10726|nr:N-acetylmuramic acid 6-phosphate etherase [Alkalihalobacillus sp. LMS6]UTR06745.1 N-acetylmuramic acid 6-phosphate etherase [Alkalihalobacillus sp. LMS6]
MLDKLQTESRNRRSMKLDQMSRYDILKLMNEEDATVPNAIERELDQIEAATTLVIDSLSSGGRLIYAGAGTSGRLGVLDAVECTPTFDMPAERVQGLIAGGEGAFLKAVEGAEDQKSIGAEDCRRLNVNQYDTVVALAASGRTPYAIGVLEEANRLGAKTVAISCNKNAEMSTYASVAIEVETGPEVLTGSTRLKAGTAQKLVLNMISTVSMIGIGKVYENLMVDVQPTNAKLVERSKRIVVEATGVSIEDAATALQKADGHVKTAIVMLLLQCEADEAKEKLQKTGGFIRKAVN